MSRATEEADGDDSATGDLFPLEGSDLFFRGEEFDILRGVGAEGETVEPELATSDSDIATLQLDMMIADAAHLWTLENHADSELIAEKIIEVSLAIDRNQIINFFLFHLESIIPHMLYLEVQH